MSNYFEETEFELREDPTIQKKPKEDIEQIDEEKLKLAIKEIRKQFEMCADGSSDLVHYATSPGRFASPVASALTALERKPTFKAMREFLQVAEQDLGNKAKEYFKGLLALAIKIKEKNDE